MEAEIDGAEEASALARARATGDRAAYGVLVMLDTAGVRHPTAYTLSGCS